MTKKLELTDGAQNQKLKIEKMLESISSMSDTEFKTWMKNISKFHNYSLQNKILIWLSGATNVMGAKQWQEKYNRKVRPDQYRWPIWILAPKLFTFTSKEIDKTGKEVEVKKSALRGFKCVKVYDLAQTTGPDLPDVYTTHVQGLTKKQTLEIATKLNFNVSYETLEHVCGGYIRHESGDIVLNDVHSDNEHIGTLLHEIAHGLLGHHLEENREDLTRDIIESEAETLTYLISSDFGIERASKFYLKSWGMDGQILKSFDKINKAYGQFQKVYKEVI